MKLHEITQEENNALIEFERKLKLNSKEITFSKNINGMIDTSGGKRYHYVHIENNQYDPPFTKMPIHFNNMKCGLDIKLETLTTLEGCPREVEGGFDLSLSDITSLKHCPSRVGTNFSLSTLIELTSLKGCPKVIPNFFAINNCPKLESLKGGPEVVGAGYHLKDCRGLKSLEGLPHTLNGQFFLQSHFSEIPSIKDFLLLYEVQGLTQIILDNLDDVAKILNKWLPTRDIAKAAQELEKVGLGEYAEY